MSRDSLWEELLEFFKRLNLSFFSSEDHFPYFYKRLFGDNNPKVKTFSTGKTEAPLGLKLTGWNLIGMRTKFCNFSCTCLGWLLSGMSRSHAKKTKRCWPNGRSVQAKTITWMPRKLHNWVLSPIDVQKERGDSCPECSRTGILLWAPHGRRMLMSRTKFRAGWMNRDHQEATPHVEMLWKHWRQGESSKDACGFELWCWRRLWKVPWRLQSIKVQEIQPVNPKRNQPWIFIGWTDAEIEARIQTLLILWKLYYFLKKFRMGLSNIDVWVLLHRLECTSKGLQPLTGKGSPQTCLISKGGCALGLLFCQKDKEEESTSNSSSKQRWIKW